MSDDLVRRLREMAAAWGHHPQDRSRWAEAADRIEQLERELAKAESIACDWCRSAGWATGHGDTLADILCEMRSQHCDERSYADLSASGGLPESPAAQGLAEARADTERLDFWLANPLYDFQPLDDGPEFGWFDWSEDCAQIPAFKGRYPNGRAALDAAREEPE